LRKGVLRPTRAAADDLQVVRRLRSWFLPDDGFEAILAGVTVAVLATGGPLPSAELAPKVFPMLGDRWLSDGHPLTEADVRMSIARSTSVLTALDLVETDWPLYRAGPSERTLLPQATAPAHLWSTASDEPGSQSAPS